MQQVQAAGAPSLQTDAVDNAIKGPVFAGACRRSLDPKGCPEAVWVALCILVAHPNPCGPQFEWVMGTIELFQPEGDCWDLVGW